MPTLPFVLEEGFEKVQGASVHTDTSHFDSTTDTLGRLSIAHYYDLARTPGLPAPWRGAGCLHADLAPGSADALISETGTWDTAGGGTLRVRFMLWTGNNLTMANNDAFAVHAMFAGGTIEGGVFVQFTTANGFRIGLGETGPTSFQQLELDQWNAVEVLYAISATATSSDGTSDGFLNGNAFTQVTGLDQGAITVGTLGVVQQDSGTTDGDVLIDDVVTDTARIDYDLERFPDSVRLTADGHAFVGPGCIKNVTLQADNQGDLEVRIYDSDAAGGATTAIPKPGMNPILELRTTAGDETVDPAGVPIRVSRGCYVEFTRTTESGFVTIQYSGAPRSDGAIRSLGARRKQRPGGRNI